MIELIQAAFLGIVQGITELLPISSSSHIVFFDRLLSFSPVDEKLFASVIQMGSAIAILMRLFPDIKHLGRGILQKKPQACSMSVSLFLAILPAAFIGFFFRTFIKETFYSNESIAYTLMIGGALLVILDPISTIMTKTQVSWKEGLGVGIAQIFSLIPGASRLGTTIIGGILSGLSRATTLKFSFLVAIPLLLGMGLFDLIKTQDALHISNLWLLCVGATTAGVMTYWLFPRIIAWLTEKGFFYIGWYRIGFGALILITKSIL